MADGPTILWLRRDLRLADHPGWASALEAGPVIPVFILDPVIEQTCGAAPKWRLGESLADLARRLETRGSRLILRRGEAYAVLADLFAETGARRVVWSRLYDRPSASRDEAIARDLADRGVAVETVNASLLHEPWTVETGSGGPYKVYTPFWRAVRGRPVPEPQAAPADLAPPATWPASDALAHWALGRAMNRGAAVVARHAVVGEDAARDRLDRFVADRIADYAEHRDRPDLDGTSGLSENLTYGEISPATAWHAGARALDRARGDAADRGPETFLKELVWREFAYHLLWHTPQITERNWRPEWDAFPWRGDNEDAERWRCGMTGEPMIDAAMREMFVTGTMHNRLRMLTASYLTKHLMTDWRVGEAWFRDCLTDWDIANNALGWQWTAGSGPDAAPYFRILNPATQAKRFDPDAAYRERFLAEGRRRPHADALSFFEAAPRAWNLAPDQPYPPPLIDLKQGRERALEAYAGRRLAG